MLAVRLLAHPMKAMTFYNTLETFSFGGANDGYFIAFGKYVYTDGVTNIFICFAIADFFYEFFCRSVCFGKVVFF